jgi:riboflavin synthase
LGQLASGDFVNIEPPAQVGDPIGGHFVTGHIDGLGTVLERHDDGDWTTLWIGAAPALLRQMASKGSIAVDGVSLTLVEARSDRFSVMLIPHTLASTSLGKREVGDCVNLETDVLAKYVERQMSREHGAERNIQ